MSNRGCFLEGLLVGAILGGLSILIASPRSREDLQEKVKRFKYDNEDLLDYTKDRTEDMIETTKASIEEGFDKLADMIKQNKTESGDVNVLNKS